MERIADSHTICKAEEGSGENDLDRQGDSTRRPGTNVVACLAGLPEVSGLR
jgi:hypothetical protein